MVTGGRRSSATAYVTGVDHAAILDTVEWDAQWTPRTWRDVLELGMEDATLLERIREATRTGRPAAAPDFVVELERRLARLLRPQKRGPKVKTAAAGGQLSLGISQTVPELPEEIS